MDRAGKAASRTYSVIKRSCNKMLIGKAYWKEEIIPLLLHGIGLINMNGEDTNKLQAIDNRVYGDDYLDKGSGATYSIHPQVSGAGGLASLAIKDWIHQFYA